MIQRSLFCAGLFLWGTYTHAQDGTPSPWAIGTYGVITIAGVAAVGVYYMVREGYNPFAQKGTKKSLKKRGQVQAEEQAKKDTVLNDHHLFLEYLSPKEQEAVLRYETLLKEQGCEACKWTSVIAQLGRIMENSAKSARCRRS